MRKGTILLLLVCIVMILVVGCTEKRDMGTVQPPTTVHGAGPATIKFQATNPSYSFRVTSSGDHAGMIVTIEGTQKDRKGNINYDKLANDAYSEKGIDVSSELKGFTSQIYIIDVSTINDKAPWTIQIQ